MLILGVILIVTGVLGLAILIIFFDLIIILKTSWYNLKQLFKSWIRWLSHFVNRRSGGRRHVSNPCIK
ncbi:MAG TPA: hypothetical protein GX717_02305 [Clostridiaceae bacterium]|nr:hypothetical protein [Clostridiaceae bacterium]